MQTHVLIVAGGSGLRMGAALPKQFLLLDGIPVLMHTIRRFYETLPSASILLVLPKDHFSYWEELKNIHAFEIPHRVVAGGETRFHSVKNGLAHIQEGIVGIHDGVRPLVSVETIIRSYDAAQEYGAAIPVISVNESLREVFSDGKNRALDRSTIRTVQTPQCFDVLRLKSAFEQEYKSDFTDDASVMEAAGHTICLVDGNEENIKITRPSDLILAEFFLKAVK